MSKKQKVEKIDWKDKYLRALADYQNLEKRVSTRSEEVRKLASRELLLKFLGILDHIEQAQIFTSDPGLKLVHENFLKILSLEQVSEMELVGMPYDPYLAECIEVIPGETDNMVVEILQKGYKIDDEVLRVAQVKVSKKI